MKNVSFAVFCSFAALSTGGGAFSLRAEGKHSPVSQFPSYEGRVMCGYQGWFRAEGDGSGEGWSHYSERGPLTAATLHPDFWPDVSEYEKIYPTSPGAPRGRSIMRPVFTRALAGTTCMGMVGAITP